MVSTKSPLPTLYLPSKLRIVRVSFPLIHIRLSVPLLPNIYPHLQTLLNFMINTLPKPVLIALLYRLSILHLASRILPTIGADTWESENVDDESTDCSVRICIGV